MIRLDLFYKHTEQQQKKIIDEFFFKFMGILQTKEYFCGRESQLPQHVACDRSEQKREGKWQLTIQKQIDAKGFLSEPIEVAHDHRAILIL